MRDLGKASQYAARRKRKQLWRTFVTVIAAVVVFCTTYALILPAITMETEGLSCGLIEHTHTADCYQLTCGKQEYFSHTHSDECYEEDVLVCTLTEQVCHHHTDACYSQPQPVCGQEEAQAHAHTEECYITQSVLSCGQDECAPHTHTDECYTDGALTCTQEETQGHTHTPECYQEQQVLSCGKQETQGHTHTEDCYPADFEPELICGQEDIPEHRHSEECYTLICGLEEHTHTELCVDNHEAYVENLNQISTEGKTGQEGDGLSTAPALFSLTRSVDSDGGIMLLADEDTGTLPVTSITGSGTAYRPETDSFTTNVRIEFAFDKVDGAKAVTAETIYTYTYPEGVTLPNDLTGTDRILIDSNNVMAGIYRFVQNDNGTYSVQVVFGSDYVSNNVHEGEPVSGFVDFAGEFTKDQFNGDSFTVSGGNISIPITGEVKYPNDATESFDIDVSKAGSLSLDGNNLVYTVIVRTTKGTPDPISFNDTMTGLDNLTLGDPTVTVEKGTTTYYSSWSYDGDKWQTEDIEHTYADGSLSMSLGKLSANETTDNNGTSCVVADTYRITYTYPITDQTVESVSPENEVTVTAKDSEKDQTVTDSAKTSVSVSKDLSYTVNKSGAIASDKPGYIKWTVTVNNNQQNLVGATLTDEMLLPTENATDVTISPNPGASFDQTQGTITFSAVDDTGVNKNTYTITYYTPVEESWDGSTVDNKAILDPDPTKEDDEKEADASVKVNGVQLDKTGSHNADTNKLDWVITVNSGNLDIAGATLTDDMFSGLSEGNFTIEPNGDGLRFIKADDKITGITFDAVADGKNTQSYTIRYSTEIPTDEGGSPVTSVPNTATLTPGAETEGEPIPAEWTITLEEAKLDKSGNYDSYNQKINWTVTVNENNKNIATAVFTDSMLGQLVPTDIVIKDGSWKVISADSGAYTINTDAAGKVTRIVFNAIGETGVNTNKYIITYSTSEPQEWTDKTVHNDALLTLDGKEIPAGADVPVPGSGEVAKSAGEGTVSEDGTTLTIPWTVTMTVPKGGLPVSTIIIDDVTKKDEWTTNTNQWITTAQKNALIDAGMTWTDDSGNSIGDKVTLSNDQVTLTGDEDAYTGFTITFEDSLIPPDGATKLTFTYFTTADLTQTGIGQNKFYNLVDVGGRQNGAEYTYYKPGVVKTDGNNQTGDTVVSSDGALTWIIKAYVGAGNTSLTLIDTLPEGVTLDSLQLTGWNSLDVTLTVGEDGTISGTDSTNQYTITGSYVERAITLNIVPQTEGQAISSGAEFTLTVNCSVENAENVTDSMELTNTVKMELDDIEIGSASQTQNWTYQESTKDVVSKSGQWYNDSRVLKYSVVLNPDGKDLVEGTVELTLTDVLKYNKTVQSWIETPQYVQKNASLIISLEQSSVKLFRTDTEPETEIKGLVWQSSSEPNEYYQDEIINTITATNVPDGVPLRLEYTYNVSSDAENGYVFNLNPTNEAKLEGYTTNPISLGNDTKWSDKTTSGGVLTTYALKLTKVDADNNGTVLKGAVFSIYAYDMTMGMRGTEPVQVFTTGEDGTVTIKQGKTEENPDDYVYATGVLFVAVETKAPDGYILPEEPEEFYFYFPIETTPTGWKTPTEIESSAIDLSKMGESLMVMNTKIPTTEIEVKKVWKQANGDELTNPSQSVTIKLYQKTTPGSSSGSSGGDVQVSFNVYKGNGEWGTYACQENVTCPSGTVFTFTLSTWGTPNITANGVVLSSDSKTGTGPYQYIYTFQADVDTAIGGYVGDGNDGLFSYTKAEPTTSDPGNSGNENFSTDDATLVGTVELNNIDGWSHTFTGLPVTGLDENNQTVTYYYYVVEDPVTNYETSYSTNGIQSGTIEVTNQAVKNPVYTLPATGGLGTTPYTMGGLLMIVAAGIPLLYSQTKRRKGAR
ncbi:MAG: SpaA isopeptide-forming pilin-related protein [Faecousia sp.]